MSDRDLLQRVADAAGIPTTPDSWNDGREPYSSGEGLICTNNSIWNPAQNDGDAFRLAVRKQVFTVHHAIFIKFLDEELAKDMQPSRATRYAVMRTVLATI